MVSVPTILPISMDIHDEIINLNQVIKMEFTNRIIKISIKENIKNKTKENNTSLFRVNDKNSIKEYYNIY
ncbi:MAG: hypothetical protein IKF79_01315 [Methanosphaera sp.]|nr:hypothetical protein [Methanosphaera sp.]MBR3213128.1 hypothetical protein [Methanosphaera sp.]